MSSGEVATDWGEKSIIFDKVRFEVGTKQLHIESEAQTRYDIIDRVVKEVLGWEHGQVVVEERQEQELRGYIDYILRAGDVRIVIEAKKVGATFPNPTKVKRIRLNSSLLKSGDVGKAITQALEYSKSKIAQITVVTNGLCWCCFETDKALSDPNTEARLLFPFQEEKDASELFNLLSNKNISEHGTSIFSGENKSTPENKLLKIVPDADTRVGRNNIADYIAPALDSALHSESIINNSDFLRSCFVYTTARQKFDKTLSMHIVDIKPISITPAKRLKTKINNTIESLIKYGKPESAPPVTLLIGGVGVGKSTYLRHYELVSGKDALEKKKVHWIYIDFESMGRNGNVRDFLYGKLKDYLLNTHQEEINGLKTGVYSLISNNETEFNKIITDHIKKDFDNTEPFVDKMFKYLSKEQLCVLVLDNTDLYEDEELEKDVLSEGLALAKRLYCHVIISIRDVTYVDHKHDSLFDAFELKPLWLDPPPFREVLSRRLILSAQILKGKSAKITASNGMNFVVPDLSVFFEIVQKSLLSGIAGNFLEAFADLNIRKGLSLVVNFLNSGHIHADKAINTYITKANYLFPFHEVFKGSILGQWKYYRESKNQQCINLFDSRLSAKNLKLLRLCILAHLYSKARSEETAKVEAKECFKIFTKLGANTEQILFVLNDLLNYGLIKTNDAKAVSTDSVVYITKAGGYHYIYLSCTMPYVEACLYDTSIEDISVWHDLADLTQQIETENNTWKRMRLRRSRFEIFSKYINDLENENIKLLGSDSHEPHIEKIIGSVGKEFDKAITSISIRK
jgi:hypothetical protein